MKHKESTKIIIKKNYVIEQSKRHHHDTDRNNLK